MRAHQPTSLAAAVEILRSEPDLVPLAGCTDWMVVRTALASPALPPPEGFGAANAGPGANGHLAPSGVLDLTRVPELRGIGRSRDGQWLEIGAATPFSEIRRSPAVRADFPALAEAAGVIGGWQIQNRATLGGNIANASPAGDSLPVLLALGAELMLAGPEGERSLPYDDFHLAYRRTALRPGELIARVRLPRPAPGTVQTFRKVGTREAQAISKVVVACTGRVERGAVAEARLAAGSVAPTPVRLRQVEELLAGRRPDPETADQAGRLAADSVAPIDDVRSSAAYRRFALARVVRRFVLELTAS